MLSQKLWIHIFNLLKCIQCYRGISTAKWNVPSHYPKSNAFTHPSFSGIRNMLEIRIPGLLVIWAYFPQTTFPPAVTNPKELTSTSIIVYSQFGNSWSIFHTPRVNTPNWVYIGLLGFFLTPIIGHCTVTASSLWVTFAFFIRNPIGLINRSI